MDILLEFTFGCKKKEKGEKKSEKESLLRRHSKFFNNDNILTFLT